MKLQIQHLFGAHTSTHTVEFITQFVPIHRPGNQDEKGETLLKCRNAGLFFLFGRKNASRQQIVLTISMFSACNTFISGKSRSKEKAKESSRTSWLNEKNAHRRKVYSKFKKGKKEFALPEQTQFSMSIGRKSNFDPFSTRLVNALLARQTTGLEGKRDRTRQMAKQTRVEQKHNFSTRCQSRWHAPKSLEVFRDQIEKEKGTKKQRKCAH